MRKTSLLTCGFLFALLFMASCNNKLPQQAKDKLFNSSDFSKAIYIEVPKPDDKNRYDNIVNNPTIVDQSWPPAVYVSIPDGKEIKDFDPKLLSYLIKNNYLDLKTAQQTTINVYNQNTKTFHFALYTPIGKSQLTQLNSPDDYGMKAGIRKLKSIDFENSYKQNIGTEIRIYSIKFSYTIEPLLPGLDEIKNQKFTGEAQMYKDPNNGEWMIQNLTLSDGGENEFIRIAQQSYQPYKEPEQSSEVIVPKRSSDDRIPPQFISFDGNRMETYYPGVHYRYIRGYRVGIQCDPDDWRVNISVRKESDTTVGWKVRFNENYQGELYDVHDDGSSRIPYYFTVDRKVSMNVH